MRIKATFNGRQKGAIGIFSPIVDHVEANTLREAQHALYDRYEHISGLKWVIEDDRGREFFTHTAPPVPWDDSDPLVRIEPCGGCDGDGTVREDVGKPFAITMPCQECGGTGEIYFDREEGVQS